MNLIVDIGNTNLKVAIFSLNQKHPLLRLEDLTEKILKNLLIDYRIEKAIISSVKEIPHFLIDILEKEVKLHILSHKSRLPFTIGYETPETLGTDRIAAVAGAFNVFGTSDILIIDAGTAITFDFINGTKYLGGNISPGIEMRFKALNRFTGKLPLVSLKDSYSFPAQNTRDAILAGVITGVTFEINEYIRTFKKDYKNLSIIITGGDSDFLKDKISSVVKHMPDIVIEGLNFILNYNAK